MAMTTTEQTITLLRTVPIFSTLSDADLQRIIESPNNGIVDFGPMKDIIREDEVGDCMYIILEGTVDVRIRAVAGREITIATLKTGEFFGEQALLPGASGKRNASVRSLQRAKLFKISKSDVLLGAKTSGQALPDTEDLSGLSEDQRIRHLLKSNRLFRSLTDHDLESVNDWAQIVHYEPGELIVRETEPGDYMYIVLEGSVEVFIVDDDGKVAVLATLTSGHYFGEQALLPQGTGRRNANVRAATQVSLIRVARDYFRLVLNRDNKLMLALRVVGDSQRKTISEILGHEPPL
jgi:CRP-like cAMP-binding protein